MARQHHISFTRAIFHSTQRLLRMRTNTNILATSQIDARTLRDIGVNPVGKF